MSFEVNRPGDRIGDRPRLSALGKRVVAIVLLLVAVVAAVVYSRAQANTRRQELAAQVTVAVERSTVVCANVLAAVGAPEAAHAELRVFVQRIEAQTLVADQAAVAQEMISYCLGYAQGMQAQVDELHGARNRIVLAMQHYDSAR